MKNKISFRASLAVFGVLLATTAAAQVDLKDLIPGSRSKRESTPIPIAGQLPGDRKTTARADAGCGPSKADTRKRSDKKDKGGVFGVLGIENPRQAATDAALKSAMEGATSALNLGSDVELPAQIENTCQATKRLSYVQKRTSRWSTSVIDSIQQAKAALELSGEAASYAAFRNNPDFSAVEGKQISQLRDDIRSDLSAIQVAITEKRKANQEMLAVASANLRSSLAEGALIGAWDKRLIEFLGDNSRWAVKEHLSDVKLFASHAELLGGTLTSIQSVVAAKTAAGGKTSTAAVKKAEAQTQQREKENDEFEKQLLAELQL